jgi:hypothetical protein
MNPKKLELKPRVFKWLPQRSDFLSKSNKMSVQDDAIIRDDIRALREEIAQVID